MTLNILGIHKKISSRFKILAIFVIALSIAITTSLVYADNFAWTQTNSPYSYDWVDIASTEDGSILYAARSNDYLYKSINSGATWETMPASPVAWSSITSSPDGTYVSATASGNGQIFTSYNSGANWTSVGPQGDWTDVAVSSSGQYQFATQRNGHVYYSSNSGSSWNQLNSVPFGSWKSIDISSNGQVILVAAESGYLRVSSNGGSSWTIITNIGVQTWSSVAISGDGSRMVAVADNNYVYISNDSGSSWSVVSGLPAASWRAVSSSDNGLVIAVAYVDNEFNRVYTSLDGGVTWSQETQAASRLWRGLAVSSDGAKLAAASSNYYIYNAVDDSIPRVASIVRRNPVSGITNASNLVFRVTFNEYVTGVTAEDFSIYQSGSFSSPAEISSVSASSGIIFDVSVTVYTSTDEGGEVRLDFLGASGGVQDLAEGVSTQDYTSGESYSIDIISPATLEAPDLIALSDTGISSTDNITNDTTPTFSILCNDDEVAETVELHYAGSGLGALASSTACTGDSGQYIQLTTSQIIGDGDYSFEARAIDVAGNVSVATEYTTVTLDTTAPSPAGAPDMTNGTDTGASNSDNITNDNTPTFTGTCSANSTIRLYDDGVATGESVSCVSSSFTATSGTLSSGANVITYKETDVAGNTSAFSTGLTVTVDTTASTISSVSSDKSNSTYGVGEVIDIDLVFSESVTSTGSVTVTLETGSTDRTCTFTVSNSTTGTCNYTVQAGDTSSDLTVSSVSGTITDPAGNTMTNFVPVTNLAANKSLVIDTISPDAPTSFIAASSGSTINLSWTNPVSDFTSSTMRRSVSGFPTLITDGTLVTNTTGTSYADTGLSDGMYYYSIFAKDSVNNVSSAATSTATVDTTAPSVSITTPTNGASVSSTIVLGASASDTVGVYGVQFKINTNTNIGTEDTVSTYAISFDTTSFVDGGYEIIAVARDASGNYATSSPVSIIIDNVPETSQDEVVQGENNSNASGSVSSNTINQNNSEKNNTNNTRVSADYVFKQNALLGVTNNEVINLQRLLNDLGFIVSSTGLGSVGNETNYFGPKTRSALALFQRSIGINPPIGYFGPITRAYINAMLKAGGFSVQE